MPRSLTIIVASLSATPYERALDAERRELEHAHGIAEPGVPAIPHGAYFRALLAQADADAIHAGACIDARECFYEDPRGERRRAYESEFDSYGIGSGFGIAPDHSRSGEPPGKRASNRDVVPVIEWATDYTLERCRALLGGKPRRYLRGGDWTEGRMEAEKLWLDCMLSNIVKRGEATIAELTRTLDRSRKTVERSLSAGDFEPIPLTGAPPGWDWRFIAPRRVERTPVEVESDRQSADAVLRARTRDYGTAYRDEGWRLPKWDKPTTDEPVDDLQNRSVEAADEPDRGTLDSEATGLTGEGVIGAVGTDDHSR